MNRIGIALTGIGLACASPAAAAQPGVTDSSFTAPDGTRTLQDSVVIEAPLAPLWKAFTDAAEYRRWSTPMAAIDLRTGGSFEAGYDPKAPLGSRDTILHRIVTYLPGKLIVFQNQHLPRALPHAGLVQQTVTVIEYAPLGPARTRVTVSSTGWKDAPEWNALYAFFAEENPEMLATLKKHYEQPAK